MLFDPANFLTHIKNLVTGGGRDVNGNAALDGGFVVDSGDQIGASVLATSVTRIVDSDGFVVLNAAAAITAVASVNFRVPRDYDEATDKLYVRFSAVMAGATNTPTLTLAVKKAAVAGAASTITAVSGATTGALSTTPQEFTVEFRGQGLTRGQRVVATITSGSHGTDALQLQNLNFSYLSTLVSYHEKDSSNNQLR